MTKHTLVLLVGCSWLSTGCQEIFAELSSDGSSASTRIILLFSGTKPDVFATVIAVCKLSPVQEKNKTLYCDIAILIDLKTSLDWQCGSSGIFVFVGSLGRKKTPEKIKLH